MPRKRVVHRDHSRRVSALLLSTARLHTESHRKTPPNVRDSAFPDSEQGLDLSNPFHPRVIKQQRREYIMGTGKLGFNETLRTQVRRLLPYLELLRNSKVKYVTRDSLLKESGLLDNEMQKLIHDGNMPRHTLRIQGQKAYEVDSTLRLLARFCHAYEYLVVD